METPNYVIEFEKIIFKRLALIYRLTNKKDFFNLKFKNKSNENQIIKEFTVEEELDNYGIVCNADISEMIEKNRFVHSGTKIYSYDIPYKLIRDGKMEIIPYINIQHLFIKPLSTTDGEIEHLEIEQYKKLVSLMDRIIVYVTGNEVVYE